MRHRDLLRNGFGIHIKHFQEMIHSLYFYCRLFNRGGPRLRWSRGSVLAFGTQVCGFKPGRSRQIFKGQIKIFSTPFFGGEAKPSVPCCRFAACKRSLNVTWKSTFRQNYRPWFLPTQFHLSLLGGLSGYMDEEDGPVTKVGTSKTLE